jgi:hypothetical protein
LLFRTIVVTVIPIVCYSPINWATSSPQTAASSLSSLCPITAGCCAESGAQESLAKPFGHKAFILNKKPVL